MMRHRFSFPGLVLLLLTLALLSYALVGLFSRMMADDYCTAAVGLRAGAWGGMLEWYQSWSGNYSNFFLKSLIAPAQPWIHPFLTLLLMGMLFAGLIRVLRRILAEIGLRDGDKGAVLFAVVLLFTTFSSAVSRQPLYWMGALLPYSVPAVLILLNISLLWWLVRSHPSFVMQTGTAILIAALVFITAGFAEIYATFQVAALAMGLTAGITFLPSDHKRPPDHTHAFLLIVGLALTAAIIGLLVSVLSPGNFARQSQLSEPYTSPGMVTLGLQVFVFTSLLFVGETFGIANFAFIFLTTIAGLFWWYAPPNREALKSLPPQTHTGRWAFVTGVIAFLLVAAMVTPPVYGAGSVASRTLFMTRLVQLALFAFWGYLTALWLARHNFPGSLARRPVYRLVRIAVLSVIMFIPLVALIRQMVLLPDVSRYATGWNARHAAILEAKARGASQVSVPPLAYDFEDYLELDKLQAEDSANWVNGCAANYYGIVVYVEAKD